MILVLQLHVCLLRGRTGVEIRAAGPNIVFWPAWPESPFAHHSQRPAQRSQASELECRSPAEALDEASHPPQVARSTGSVGCLDHVLGQHPVFRCAVVDLHAAKSARARRIASERDMCSRAVNSSSASILSAVKRTAMTCIGSAPRPGRPRPRRFNSSAS